MPNLWQDFYIIKSLSWQILVANQSDPSTKTFKISGFWARPNFPSVPTRAFCSRRLAGPSWRRDAQLAPHIRGPAGLLLCAAARQGECRPRLDPPGLWASVSSAWAPRSSTSNSPPSDEAGGPVAQNARGRPVRPGILKCYKEYVRPCCGVFKAR